MHSLLFTTINDFSYNGVTFSYSGANFSSINQSLMEEKQTYMSASSSLLLVSAENEVPRLSSVSSSVLRVEKVDFTWVIQQHKMYFL